jgi:hypothetical protein
MFMLVFRGIRQIAGNVDIGGCCSMVFYLLSGEIYGGANTHAFKGKPEYPPVFEVTSPGRLDYPTPPHQIQI